MGLIYVNFEGLKGVFDFMGLVKNICIVFLCMVMNDEEIVVFIVGGYIFGKMYGVYKFLDCLGVEFGGVGFEE